MTILWLPRQTSQEPRPQRRAAATSLTDGSGINPLLHGTGGRDVLANQG